MEGFIDRIKQYAAKEQAELRVRIKIPGSWFPGLRGAEKMELYEAEAYAFEEAHRFQKTANRAAQTCQAIRFICVSDLQEDANASGQFIMPVADWNRYRHDTYKNDRTAELPYIPTTTDKTGADRATENVPEPSEPERPKVYSEFSLVGTRC